MVSSADPSVTRGLSVLEHVVLSRTESEMAVYRSECYSSFYSPGDLWAVSSAQEQKRVPRGISHAAE